MLKVFRLIVVLAAFSVVTGIANGITALAAAQAKEPTQITGELLRVSVETMTFTVKVSNGPEMEFRYTQDTAVTGADKGVAGLATMGGTPVTVLFRTEGAENIATKIEVHQPKQQG